MVNRGMTMQGLGAMAIGVLVLVVAFTIIPLVGSELEQTITLPSCQDVLNQTGCASNGYMWNSSINSDIPTPYDMWESVGGILQVAAVIVIVGGFLQTLRGLRN